MKRFIYKVLLLVFVVICVDLSAGFVFSNLFSKAKSGIAYKENYIFNKTNEDLLIFGSSRAEHHYIPEILQNETKINTYNVGREGAGIFFHYAVFLSTLERYKPKVVILDLDHRDVYLQSNNFGPNVVKEAAPFYGKINKEFDSLLVRDFYDYFLYQSNLYKYNKKFFPILTGAIRNEKKFDGYVPISGKMNSIPKDSIIKDFSIDKDLVKVTRDFILKAKKNNIRLIVVLSPSYKKLPLEFEAYVNSLESKYNINIINHFKDTTFLNHPNYFRDIDHLNDEGAKLYSKIISKEINTILEQK